MHMDSGPEDCFKHGWLHLYSPHTFIHSPPPDQDDAQSKSSYSQSSGASNNGGGGSGGSYDTGRSGGFSNAAAKDEDPFEATRRRIEKVKQESAQPEPVSSAAFKAQAAAAAAADAAAAAAAPTMPFAGGAEVLWPCFVRFPELARPAHVQIHCIMHHLMARLAWT